MTRNKAAEVIANYFGIASEYVGGTYDGYKVLDNQNRTWKVVRDSSIYEEYRNRTANGYYSVEVVSPICVYKDIEIIQQIVRNLRKAGAIANDSCGIHVHIDASPFDAQKLRNLTNIMAAKEDLIYKALQVNVMRENRYCQKVEESFLNELNKAKPKSMEKLNEIWYEDYGGDGSRIHYHDSRYHALNLHSVFSKGTIEFRLFNSTTHAGKIKAYIQLCLAITNQALSQRSANYTKTQSTNEKYTFRTWLLRLGLIGDEFIVNCN